MEEHIEESKKESRKRHKKNILECIKQRGSVSKAELKKKWLRQSIRYNIPQLCKEGLIRPYIKGNGLNDEDIIYVYVNKFDYPQEVLELMERMCDRDISKASKGFDDFIDLYMRRLKANGAILEERYKNKYTKEVWEKIWELHMKEEEHHAKQLAWALMSGMTPIKKEEVAFKLTHKNICGGYDMDDILYKGRSIQIE